MTTGEMLTLVLVGLLWLSPLAVLFWARKDRGARNRGNRYALWEKTAWWSIAPIWIGTLIVVFLAFDDEIPTDVEQLEAVLYTAGLLSLPSFSLAIVFGQQKSRALLQVESHEVASRDPQVLYLRAFVEDRQAHTDYPDGLGWIASTVDQFLGPGLRTSFGEIIALGSPLDQLPPGVWPGRATPKLYESDDSWQDRVSALASTVRVILLHPGATSALQWELTKLRELGLHTKLFAAMPPASRYSKKRVTVAPEGIVAAFADAGYSVQEEHLLPGSVLTFDDAARSLLLATGLGYDPAPYVEAIGSRVTPKAPPVSPPGQLYSWGGLGL